MDDWKDIYYLRLSKEDGDSENGNVEESCSIQSQRKCIQKYLQENGFDVNGFLEIVDDGYSGTTMNRPGMNRIMKMVESGTVRTVVVRDLSRFSRNYLEAGQCLEFMFPVYNVRFISINDRFDSKELGETTGGLDLAIRNMINQMYSKDLSKKIKSVVDLKKLGGEYVYGCAPYGYRKGERKNTIVIDEPAAKIVKQIFEWAASGITVTNIAVRLNQAGTPTPSAYLAKVRGNYPTRMFWSYESVRNILENRIYTGDTVPFRSHVVRVGSNRVKQIPEELRQVILNTHDAIVSRDLFFQASAVIKSVKKKQGKHSENPFVSLLVCGCCGSKLSKGKEQNKTWMCSMHRYVPDKDCRNVRIDDAKLTQIVLNAITVQCRLLDGKIRSIRQENHSQSAYEILRNESLDIQRQIERIRSEKMTLYEKYVRAEMTKDEYTAQKSELSAREEKLKIQDQMNKQKMEVVDENARMSKVQATVAAAEKFTQYQELTSLTPELTKELIQRIVIHPDRSIRIEWNFLDELAELAEMRSNVVCDTQFVRIP